MSALQPSDFAEFFRSVYNGRDPFPWQQRLADRVCAAEGNWPRCIALPTAAGKTACIDIAVFAVACQAELPREKRTAPRRIFFVVDRRVVVDQAFEHAKALAEKLDRGTRGIRWMIAEQLRGLVDPDWPGLAEADRRRILSKRLKWKYKKGWSEPKRQRFWNDLTPDERRWIDIRPLDFYALRGGMYRESAWVRSPLQPTIVTSTVDQVGSRLLFRGYGVSDPSKPLHAAMVGNDALILLDEAHCAKPFDQTMTLVEKYRVWADQPLRAPFRFVTMTATPAAGVVDSEIERDRKDDHAHPELGKRIKASKPTALVPAKTKSGNWRPELVKELVKQARKCLDAGFLAVGVIVNRVVTARETASALKADGVDVILLTGRMRPVDRDALMTNLEPLFSGKSGNLPKPTFVVATQCLEVGADLDFHALVTECASLDALRQRFGRLNRVAARPNAKAAVVVRADQTEPTDDEFEQDPVYGNSLANTWKWLNKHAHDKVFDFGVAAVAAATNNLSMEELATLNAPSDDAAVLLPAHLDCWAQTSPIPVPDPDPAVFLHGPSRGVPDVQVVFRADLGEHEAKWAEIVSLCPPSSSEALPARLDVFRRWLGNAGGTDESSDVEGERAADSDAPQTAVRSALRWSGPGSDRTIVITAPGQVRPGDLFVLPTTAPDVSDLGDFPTLPPKDHGDEAFQKSRDRAILRLTPTLLQVALLDGVTREDDDFEDNLSDTIESLPADADWLQRAVVTLSKRTKRMVKQHPLGGFVVVGKHRLGQFDPTFVEADDLPESSSQRPIMLANHNRDVATFARRFADECGLQPSEQDAFELAGLLHDAGKIDPRFQAWLRGGDRRRADLAREPLAKSETTPSRAELGRLRERAGYPAGGRHEFLSVRLAENKGVLPADSDLRDMILHLIASHHGCCRPFATVVEDESPESVVYPYNGRKLQASTATGLERLDSGVAERFWKLTRRFGWWGLSWLEAMLRLADWAASEAAAKEDQP